MKLRDHNRCRFPGCAHQRYVEAHHVEHWIDGGETRLDNLVLLCSAHHRLLHHGAFRIVVEDDGLVFVSRDGEVIEPALRPQFPATFPPVFPGKRHRLDVDLPDDARCAPPAFLKRAGGALTNGLHSGTGTWHAVTPTACCSDRTRDEAPGYRLLMNPRYTYTPPSTATATMPRLPSMGCTCRPRNNANENAT